MTDTDGSDTGGAPDRPRAGRRRRRRRPATVARVLVTGMAVSVTGILVASMGADRPAQPNSTTVLAAAPPATPPRPITILVVQTPAEQPSTGAPNAGTARPAAVTPGVAPVTPSSVATPAPVTNTTAS